MSGLEALPRRVANAIIMSSTQPQHPNIWNIPREVHQRIIHGNLRKGHARNNREFKDIIIRGQYVIVMAVSRVTYTAPEMSSREPV